MAASQVQGGSRGRGGGLGVWGPGGSGGLSIQGVGVPGREIGGLEAQGSGAPAETLHHGSLPAQPPGAGGLGIQGESGGPGCRGSMGLQTELGGPEVESMGVPGIGRGPGERQGAGAPEESQRV